MQFLLTPPMVLKKDLCYSLIQIGDMELPESLVISMSGWTALELVTHWRSEIGELVAFQRDRCCIVSGLKRDIENKVVPSEWWLIYLSRYEAIFQYQVLFSPSDFFHQSQEPENWWKKIGGRFSDPDPRAVSEWIMPARELVDWCNQTDVLLNAIERTEELWNENL